jgi:hypothetical protein
MSIQNYHAFKQYTLPCIITNNWQFRKEGFIIHLLDFVLIVKFLYIRDLFNKKLTLEHLVMNLGIVHSSGFSFSWATLS